MLGFLFQKYVLIVALRSVMLSDGTMNQNRVSEISDVFLESESEEVDLISDLATDSS